MAKRLTDKQKSELIDSFKNGTDINELSEKFSFTSITITRHLKNFLGDSEYKKFSKKNKVLKDVKQAKHNHNSSKIEKNSKKDISVRNFLNDNYQKNNSEEDLFQTNSFIEITPLDYEIENHQQKDLSSVPLEEVEFPKMVYMIVNDNVELEIKPLRDYPDWQFLSNDELNRKTIEIFFDLKIAKNSCGKGKKLIKIPNTDVFRIVSPILISRGISRIVSKEKLIAI